ncbi:hypothetical protein EIP91_004047 [Steccherinum ochraceum]|uniref:Uncharacterized protein n=1 Tax=Steccherinum ochraceum TaxID=92696 RepID=A0A4R0RC18_9APHY|nr:hypothetical protein EIP91_004047 [Steccherinum ochraceum]
MSVELVQDQEDWIEVDEQWWRSPYEDAPWSYQRQFLWSLDGVKYAKHPPPPHYLETLCNVKAGWETVEDVVAEEQSLELNGELAGAKGAVDVMGRYEFDVGITPPLPPQGVFLRSQERRMFSGDLTNQDVSTVHGRWDDQVRGLFGDAFRRSQLDASFDWDFDQKVWDLGDFADTPSRTSTSPDVVDLTDSELSADSEPLPSTPNADRKSYAQVVFVDRAGQQRTVIAPTPAKPLNASALSFIPGTRVASDVPSRESSESPYTSPTYEFHFPSLTANPPSARTTTQSLPSNLEMDEQGFYIEIPSPPSATFSDDSTRTATPKRPSASLLPAFLADASSNARSRHASKTRAIVDRLRSSTSSVASEPPRRSAKKTELTSSRRPAEDPVIIEDGEADVFADPMSNIDGWITSIENEALASGPPLYNDGWIEGPTKARRTGKAKSHKRSGSSVSSVAPTTPTTTSSTTTFSSPSSAAGYTLPATSPTTAQFATPPYYSFPSPYGASPYGSAVYPAIPPPAPTQAQMAYFQMQYQMQLQAQAQWQMQMHANARMQAGMGYPVYQQQPPVPVPPQPATAPTPSVTHSRTKSVPYTEPKRITVPITGVAGIRHA